jgi:hypothetical protein
MSKNEKRNQFLTMKHMKLHENQRLFGCLGGSKKPSNAPEKPLCSLCLCERKKPSHAPKNFVSFVPLCEESAMLFVAGLVTPTSEQSDQLAETGL